MTRNANSLTKGATSSRPRESTAWTLPASDLRATMIGLASLDYDASALLAFVGLSESDLEDPDVRVPCDVYGRMVGHAQQQRFTRNLALELARVTPMGAYPLLDYLVLTSDTVGAGARQLANYFRLVGSPIVLTVDDAADPVRVAIAGTPLPFSAEYSLSLMVGHFRAETGGGFTATVCFQHEPDDAAAFERVLGCSIVPASLWSGLSVPLEAWRLPLRRRDPVLRQMLEGQADAILARVPAREGLALTVQRAIAAQLVGGDTSIAAIARGLAMSARTLQRRLGGEGASYHELLDETRKEAARRQFEQPALALGEIAYLLGYSEPSAFHRAFKRWYGVTPDAFRQSIRSSPRRQATGAHDPSDAPVSGAEAAARSTVSRRAEGARRNG